MNTNRLHKPTLLVALGGNALIQKNQAGTIEQQFQNLRVPIQQIARLSNDYKIIMPLFYPLLLTR